MIEDAILVTNIIHNMLDVPPVHIMRLNLFVILVLEGFSLIKTNAYTAHNILIIALNVNQNLYAHSVKMDTTLIIQSVSSVLLH